MKPKKPDRSVSEMDVLKDISGLLSTTRGREDSTEARLEDEGGLRAKIACFEEEVRRYKELAQKQQEELDRARSENKELTARLNMLCPDKDKPISPEAEKLGGEIAQLEVRKAELSLVLSQVDGLLQLKVKELLKRIGRLYQEAGDGEMAFEFRRAGDDLEIVENFAHFVRALLS